MRTQGGKTKKQIAFQALKRAVRFFFPAHRVSGADNVREGSPAVFVCNHMGSYAPVVMELFFPFPFRPWVTYQVVAKKLCRKYLEQDFVKKELGWKRPLSGWLSAAIEPFCIRVLRSAGAIPVYKGKREIRETFRRSVAALREGNHLAVFLTGENRGETEPADRFPGGFVHLAKLYHRETGRELLFYPVFVSRKERTVTIGRPVGFDSENDFRAERTRILSCLRYAMGKAAPNNR